MNARAIAKKLPWSIKQTLKAAYGAIPPRFRLGRAFWETYDFLERSQWWDCSKLKEYQMRELRRLLAHSYEQVPYYRRVFDEHGLKPNRIQSPADFQRVPCLRKEQVKKEPQAFLTRNRRIDRLATRDTSGTSGEPLQFPVDRDELEREWAFVCHQWSRVGYRPGDARVDIRGQYVRGERPYEWDPAQRVLRLAPVVRDESVARLYLDLIRTYQPKFLCGYPSAVTHFASRIRQYGLHVEFQLTAVLFVSETLYAWQRTLVENVFGCRSYNFYGLAEHVAIAGECEASRALHCVPQYGITEVDPQTGEIIGTGFLNHAHPFIRYKTNDIASVADGCGCEQCGRPYFPILAEIEGRLQDFVVTPDGVSINSCMLEYPFDASRTIACVQIVQEAIDRVTIRAAPIDTSNVPLFATELARARKDLQRILGNEMKISSETMSAEEYAGSGKLRFIVSHLPQELRGYQRNTRA
jgi:phenylacetate-CoA ligase